MEPSFLITFPSDLSSLALFLCCQCESQACVLEARNKLDITIFC